MSNHATLIKNARAFICIQHTKLITKLSLTKSDRSTIHQILYCVTVELLCQIWIDSALANSEIYASIRASFSVFTVFLFVVVGRTLM